MLSFLLQQPITSKHSLGYHFGFQVAMFLIRWKHYKVSTTATVSKSSRGILERILMTCSGIAVFSPLIHSFIKVFFSKNTNETKFPGDLAVPRNYFQFLSGISLGISGLTLLHFSHRDLDRNWSSSLEIREDHQLVKTGTYSLLRHPMYTAFFLFSFSFPLTTNNNVGWAFVVTNALIVFSRLFTEEEMMRQTFGKEYDDFCATRYRLIPFIF